MCQEISLSGRRSPPASKADMENGVDAPELPFFFPDKDSICHEAICSLWVRISMISNHSTMQNSPWCHLYTRLSTDTTEPHCEGPVDCPQNSHPAKCHICCSRMMMHFISIDIIWTFWNLWSSSCKVLEFTLTYRHTVFILWCTMLLPSSTGLLSQTRPTWPLTPGEKQTSLCDCSSVEINPFSAILPYSPWYQDTETWKLHRITSQMW